MLLIRPIPKNNEHIPGYLLRVVAANGYKNPTALLRYCGKLLTNNRIPGSKLFFGEFDVAKMAELAQITTAQLTKCQLQRVSAGRCEFYQHNFRLKHITLNQISVCPSCFEEENVISFINSFVTKTYCTKHQCRLITCHPVTGKSLTWGTQYLWRDIPNWNKINQQLATEAEFAINLNIELLTSDQQAHLPAMFNQCKLGDYIDIISFLSHYHHRAFIHESTAISENIFFSVAHRYLMDWPISYFELLAYFEEHPMLTQRQSGIRYCYRDLYDNLYSPDNDCSKGYALLRKYFEQYLCDHFQSGPLLSRIKFIDPNTLKTSNLLNENQACTVLKCVKSRLTVYVRESLLPVANVLSTGIKLYSRADLMALRRRIDSTCSLEECAASLNLSRYQAQNLLRNGLITPLLSPSNENRDWLIEQSELARLIDKLKVSSTTQSNSDIASAKRFTFLGLNISSLINKMLNGQISFSFQASSKLPMSFTQFTLYDLFHDEPNTDYSTPKIASEELDVNINAIYDFIKKGFLVSKMLAVKRTARPVKMITVTSIRHFKVSFLLKRQIKSLPSVSYTLISGPTIDHGIVNLYRLNATH